MRSTPPPARGAGADGIPELAEAGACAFKVSTYEYHPVRFPGYDTGELFEIFPAIAETGLPVAFHNEDPYIVRRLTEQFARERRNTPEAHGASRPPLAELIANVGRLRDRAGDRGALPHRAQLARARVRPRAALPGRTECGVSAETCVQYLVFDEEDVLRMGARLKQNPPIRPAGEKAALWERIAADEIDFVSSDHVAWPLSRKSDPDIFKNGAGIPGLETIFPALYTGMVTERAMSPARVAELLSERPARHFGLFPRKGALIPGGDADFIVVDPSPWTFDAANMASEVKWSPYDGMRFGARVEATYVRGKPVFMDGQVVAPAGSGAFIRPA